MTSTMSNLNLQMESTKTNHFLHPLCNGDEFPLAWSQNVVLILEQLENGKLDLCRTCCLG